MATSEWFQVDRVNCPECGRLMRGTLETLKGCSPTAWDEDQNAMCYDGGTEIFWDSQRTEQQGDRPLALCSAGHTWPIEVRYLAAESTSRRGTTAP